MQNLFVGVIGIAGVIVGASLQHWFSRVAEFRREQRGSRARAYADFISAVVAVSIKQTNNQDVSQENWIALGEARARVAVYGDPAVVRAIAAFWRLGAKFATAEQKRAFVAICNDMRRATYGKDVVDNEDMQLLIFG